MARFDPTREAEEIQERLGQLIAEVFGDLSAGEGRRQIMPVDIEETDDAYVVELDLPNVRPQDVDVELNDNELRISGEYKVRERSGTLRRRARPAGQFEYVISLPGEIDAERVEATLADGVLTVTVGKASASRARHVEVHGND